MATALTKDAARMKIDDMIERASWRKFTAKDIIDTEIIG
jgi:hypothetical protein